VLSDLSSSDRIVVGVICGGNVETGGEKCEIVGVGVIALITRLSRSWTSMSLISLDSSQRTIAITSARH